MTYFPPFSRTISFCGLPKAGKTTIVQTLASLTQTPFQDTDDLVLQHPLSLPIDSCSLLVQTQGLAYFRKIEQEVVQSLSPTPHSLIALGGGTLLFAANAEKILSLGPLVYLDTPLDIIRTRLLATPLSYLHPDTLEEEIETLCKQRMTLYRQYATLIIDTKSQNPIAIAQHLYEILHHDT